MKRKNAFTLIQIVCSVVVIGVVSIILLGALNYDFSKNRSEFYKDLLTKVSDSGEDFFYDNSKYYPKELFESQKVTLGTLVANDYIDEIVDYNKKDCSDDSYVIAIKVDKDKYIYKTCLVCKKDDYSNMNETYCDSSWADSSTISYGIVDEPLFYISKGSPIEDKLDLPLSLIKRNYSGNILAVLNPTNTVKISPVNINDVNVNAAGEYIINYEYEGYVSQGKVIVYENPAPKVSVGYKNKVASGYSNERIESGYLEDGEWAQKVVLTFSKGDYYHTEISNVVKYQWYINGVWEDICVGSDLCAVEIEKEMDETVKFRSVDDHGNVSETTNDYTIRIDNTKPSCELSAYGSLGDNNWYVNDVEISFAKKEDSSSGVKINSINLKKSTFSRDISDRKTLDEDTNGITFIGYVEDYAGNYSTCEITIKKDSEAPTCTSSGDAESWTNKSRSIKFGCSDKLSGCNQKYSGGTYTYDETTETAIIPSYEIRDNAGNITRCEERTANVYIDKVKPTCTASGDSTVWTKEDRIIEFGCVDDESGCEKKTAGSITFNTTSGTAKLPKYTINDKAGNETVCDGQVVNVFVDKTKPTCTFKKTSELEESGVNVELYCNDEESGCVENNIYKYDLKSTQTFTVTDNVGNTGTCEVPIVKQILRSDATCTKYKTCTSSSCGQEKYDCSECKTGTNTCAPGYDYGSWGTCSLTKRECNAKEGVECEPCGNNGYYHARTKTLNPCKTGENTCKYGCSMKDATCSSPTCGCEEYGDYKEYYKVPSCEEQVTNEAKTRCKTVYK